MAAETQYHPPLELTQGESAAWTTVNGDYPATDGFSGAFTLVSGAGSLTVNATASGADFLFAITAAQSAALHPGSYQFVLRLTDGSTVQDVESGYLYILPDITATQPLGVSGASTARTALAFYNSILTNEAYVKTLDVGRLPEMEQSRWRWMQEVKREEDAEKIKRNLPGTSRKLFTRFA